MPASLNELQSNLVSGTPEAVGLDPQRWQRVLDRAARLVEQGTLPALSIQVQRNGLATTAQLFGSRSLTKHQPVDAETRFLIASLTKPMVAMATLLLVERGAVTLNQRVVEVLPEFKGPNKRPITIKHLLTHTSGLPDMLPNNRELRAANAPLEEFVRETATTELVYSPGTSSQYQSMGYALLGAIIEQVSGMSCADFLQRELFTPLGMQRATLGLGSAEQDDPNIAEVRLPADQVGEDHWNWNSRYWKSFGAPWGGVLATAEDVTRFCWGMLNGGLSQNGEQLFHPQTVTWATTNRLLDFREIPEAFATARGWGYGWRLNWPDHRACLCELGSPATYGHWGATGTLCWLDPATRTAAVLLSTEPESRDLSPLLPLSNMLAAAIQERK